MKKIKIEREVTKEDVYVKAESVEDSLEIRAILEAAEEAVDLGSPYSPQDTYLVFDDVDNDWFYRWGVSGLFKITIPQLAELLGVEYPLKKKSLVGKWYKFYEEGCLVFKVGEGGLGYGWWRGQWGGRWAIPRDLAQESGWTEATKEEVKEALVAEAKRRYGIGDRVSQVNCYNWGSMYGEDPWVYKGVNEWLFQYNSLFNENLCLMLNGEWAEVVEQKQLPTLEELIAEAKSKITVRPETYPCWVEGMREIKAYYIGGISYASEKSAIAAYISKKIQEEYL